MNKALNIVLNLLATVLIVAAALKAWQLLTEPVAGNEPANVAASYEVLEPETWLGKELPILEYIDIASLLEKGNWLILFYHHDCPDCIEAIPKYEQIARELAGNEDFLRIALIEVPPYGPTLLTPGSPCIPGRLTDKKQWFITTPAVILLENGTVQNSWEEKLPTLDSVFRNSLMFNKSLILKLQCGKEVR